MAMQQELDFGTNPNKPKARTLRDGLMAGVTSAKNFVGQAAHKVGDLKAPTGIGGKFFNTMGAVGGAAYGAATGVGNREGQSGLDGAISTIAPLAAQYAPAHTAAVTGAGRVAMEAFNPSRIDYLVNSEDPLYKKGGQVLSDVARGVVKAGADIAPGLVSRGVGLLGGAGKYFGPTAQTVGLGAGVGLNMANGQQAIDDFFDENLTSQSARNIGQERSGGGAPTVVPLEQIWKDKLARDERLAAQQPLVAPRITPQQQAPQQQAPQQQAHTYLGDYGRAAQEAAMGIRSVAPEGAFRVGYGREGFDQQLGITAPATQQASAPTQHTYRYKDSNGVTHYSDTEPPTGVGAREIHRFAKQGNYVPGATRGVRSGFNIEDMGKGLQNIKDPARRQEYLTNAYISAANQGDAFAIGVTKKLLAQETGQINDTKKRLQEVGVAELTARQPYYNQLTTSVDDVYKTAFERATAGPQVLSDGDKDRMRKDNEFTITANINRYKEQKDGKLIDTPDSQQFENFLAQEAAVNDIPLSALKSSDMPLYHAKFEMYRQEDATRRGQFANMLRAATGQTNLAAKSLGDITIDASGRSSYGTNPLSGGRFSSATPTSPTDMQAYKAVQNAAIATKEKEAADKVARDAQAREYIRQQAMAKVQQQISQIGQNMPGMDAAQRARLAERAEFLNK